MSKNFNAWLEQAVGRELDDAFQFENPDGSRHSYVTRAWVERLLWSVTTAATTAERNRCAKLAEDLGVQYLKITPVPRGSTYMPGCELRPFSERIRETPK